MKTIINLSIDVEVWKKAKESSMNVSQFVENKLKQELKIGDGANEYSKKDT